MLAAMVNITPTPKADAHDQLGALAARFGRQSRDH
jgi:hypothetical protein